VVAAQDRIGRDMYRVAGVMHDLKEAGIAVWFYDTNERAQWDEPEDELMGYVRGFGGAYQRKRASITSRNKSRALFLAGHVATGRSLGYRSVDVKDALGRHSHFKREVDPEQAAIVQRIFEWANAGLGLAKIVNRLHAEGIPNPTGLARGISKDDVALREQAS